MGECRLHGFAFSEMDGAGHAAGQNDHFERIIGREGAVGHIRRDGNAVRAFDRSPADADGADILSGSAQAVNRCQRFDLLKALREKYIYHSCASVSVYFKSPDMHTISSYYTMYLHESQDIMIVSGGVNALKISPARARLPFKM